jgi:hypothetical protein
MSLGRDFDSSFEREESERAREFQKSREKWTNIEL